MPPSTLLLPAPAGGVSGGGCVTVVDLVVDVNARTVLVLGRFVGVGDGRIPTVAGGGGRCVCVSVGILVIYRCFVSHLWIYYCVSVVSIAS